MLIPIGHEEHKVARLPWVTIALIVANITLFLFTYKVAERQGAERRARQEEILRYVTEHPHLTLPSELRGAVSIQPPPPDHSVTGLAEEQGKLNTLAAEYRAGARQNLHWKYGYVPGEPGLLALFTSLFFHAGWLHLLGNMLFLALAGGSLERRWGRIALFLFYVVSGVVATLGLAVLTPSASTPAVGASGAVAGMMGAFLVGQILRRSLVGAAVFLLYGGYWVVVFRDALGLPIELARSPWLLQQLTLVVNAAGGAAALWAQIGSFVVGVAVALVVQLSGFESRARGSSGGKSGAWSASDQLTGALGKLDAGDASGAIRELVALLRNDPNSVEVRAALVDAYARNEDRASAGRESARLVGAYLAARDVDGALAAMEEHQRAYPELPPRLRDSLALAAHREKQGQSQAAAALYQEAITACPDDPLTPKALVNYGRLLLEVLNQPDEASEVLEQVASHPKVTPDFVRASEEMLATLRALRGASLQEAPAPAVPPPPPELPEPEPHSTYGQIELHPETSHDTPQLLTEATLMLPGPDSGAPEVPAEPTYMLGLEDEPPVQPSLGFAEPEPTPPSEPEPAEPTYYLSLEDEPPLEPAPPIPEPEPARKLVPIVMRAVGIDARGLHLEDPDGKTGRMPWQEIAGLAVGSLGDVASNPSRLIVDLLMGPLPVTGTEIQTVRITGADLAIPQLASEPPLRAAQRLVATILKTSGATPFPNREACLGTRGFSEFPDLAAYEADLIAQLTPAGDPTA